ncbi:MAG: glycosyltransferase family 1 protein [Bacteroidota bacterium]|nr:glycosyltransferase family 1 protein [Bacteroidota bacterium]
MKIGIEGQRLFREKKHGMDMVALELVRELQKIDKKNQYFIYVKPDVDSACLQSTDNFKIVELEGGSYPQWEQKALPRQAKTDGCDVLHCTSNTAPIKPGMPLIVTLHDIIYMEKSYFGILTDKGTTYQKFGNVYRRWYVPKIVKNSDILITVSNFEKKRISDFFGIKNNKLHAVYNGVSEHFKNITDKIELERVKNIYKLPEKYFFFLGNTDPKKNTKGTLKAFSDFRRQSSDDYKLVMLDYDEVELVKLLDEIGDRPLRKHIILTGYVVNTDLPAIYSMCNIFLYPSLRESFGIPMLEAMRCAVPVITSNTSSMPEVSGDGAYIIDPFKPEEITRAILKIQGDDQLRQSLIEKGLKRSEYFSWKNMAKNVLELYESFA